MNFVQFFRNRTFLTVTDSGPDASTVFRGADGKALPGVVNGAERAGFGPR
jgi:hypothetical protein